MDYVLSVCLKGKKLTIRKRALEWNEVLTNDFSLKRAANLGADACHSYSLCPEANIQCLPLPASFEMELLSLNVMFTNLDELEVRFSLVPSQQEAIGADRPGTLWSLPPRHRDHRPDFLHRHQDPKPWSSCLNIKCFSNWIIFPRPSIRVFVNTSFILLNVAFFIQLFTIHYFPAKKRLDISV